MKHSKDNLHVIHAGWSGAHDDDDLMHEVHQARQNSGGGPRFANQDGSDNGDDQTGTGQWLTDNSPALLGGFFKLGETIINANAAQSIANAQKSGLPVNKPGTQPPPPANKPASASSNVGKYVLVIGVIGVVLTGVYFVVKSKKK